MLETPTTPITNDEPISLAHEIKLAKALIDARVNAPESFADVDAIHEALGPIRDQLDEIARRLGIEDALDRVMPPPTGLRKCLVEAVRLIEMAWYAADLGFAGQVARVPALHAYQRMLLATELMAKAEVIGVSDDPH